jgi:magnesium transporter
MVNTLFLPELREMLADNNALELQEFCTALHPARTAEFMEGLDSADTWRVLGHADLKLREEIFTYFPSEKQREIIESQDRTQIAELLADLPADDRVDLLRDVSHEVVEELLPLLPAHERRELLRLREYPEDSAGAMMTTEVAMIDENLTVREAIDALTHAAERLETIYYIYAVDRDQRLDGVVTARQLLTALKKPDMKVADLMESDLIVVEASADRNEVTNLVAKYDLHAIPVVDERRRLLGIITHDDVIDAVRLEATEEAQRSAAVAPLEDGYMQTSLITLWWKRGVWLTVLFVTAMFTATALRHYEGQLKTWTWLVIFIPLIMSSGGNCGNQSATLIITALTSGNVRLGDWRVVAWRELRVGLMLGGLLAVLGGIISWLQTLSEKEAHAHPFWPLVVPLTLVLVVTCGAVSGSLLPLFFKRMGLDPALMSNPFVAAISDILAIVIYMTVAMTLLSMVETAAIP